MPAKKGFCWCLGGTAPPEISYGLENGGMTLKPIEVDIPMPQDEEELNSKFTELVDELGLDKPHREAMFNLPAEKKWQIYCSKKKEQEDPNSASWPDYYVERVTQMASVFFVHDDDEVAVRVKLVESLKTALRTQPMSFVMRFIELDGLNCLLSFLTNMDYKTAQSSIHTAVIGCTKALLNNSQGRAHVLAHPTCINTIAQSLSCDQIRTKIAVLEILGAICLVPGGHRKVLQAMDHFQKYACERTRFQTLISDLDRSTGEYREEVNLKTAIMSFINAALKYGPGQTHLEFRLHLRFEFLMLGIQPVLEKLRTHDNATLDRHLDFFDMVRTEDERQLAKKFESNHVDTRSASAMFDLLKKKLNYTTAYPHFLSVLFHFLHLPLFAQHKRCSCACHQTPTNATELGRGAHNQACSSEEEEEEGEEEKEDDKDKEDRKKDVDEVAETRDRRECRCCSDFAARLPIGNGPAVQYWQLIDRIVQQISIQTKDGDPDVSPLELDVKKLVKQLANENTMKEVHGKIREIQKDNDELSSRLAKKERECEVKEEEKEDLMATLNTIRHKMEKEAMSYVDAKLQLVEMTARIEELQQLVELERAERLKLEHAVKTGSLPDDAKVGVASFSAALAAASKQSSIALASSISAASPPPPPPPPGGGPPAPPPPPGGAPPPPAAPGLPGQLGGHPGMAMRSKRIPASKQALKSFNWAKLPDNKLKGTVWTEIDDQRLYHSLDLDEFERMFSAYQRHEGTDDTLNKAVAKTRELSVIDGRRAQNCQILLSKLKMTNTELSRAIMSMDRQEELPKDMCEQLLKFVPNPEEAQMLSEHEHEIEQMARADRFLFEMSRIDHYEQRLKALYYKKKCSERMSDAKPKVEAVLEASKEVTKSRRLKKLLEIVLAFGNFMNRGQRGNASGFKISSLNKIVDTKSSIDKRITLLHYLASVVERRFPDLLKLENELKHVHNAAKVNLSELEAEISVLRAGRKDIEKELDYHRKKGPVDPKKDRFVPVMTDFTAVATINFSELEEKLAEMREKCEKASKVFAEDAKQTPPDEFFGVFALFLTTFRDVRIDNERIRKQKEEEEKRANLEAQLRAEREKQRGKISIVKGNGSSNGNGKVPNDKGEFDDLISALRTGDVFGEEMVKLKRTRRRINNQKVVGDTTRERIGVVKS